MHKLLFGTREAASVLIGAREAMSVLAPREGSNAAKGGNESMDSNATRPRPSNRRTEGKDCCTSGAALVLWYCCRRQVCRSVETMLPEHGATSWPLKNKTIFGALEHTYPCRTKFSKFHRRGYLFCSFSALRRSNFAHRLPSWLAASSAWTAGWSSKPSSLKREHILAETTPYKNSSTWEKE